MPYRPIIVNWRTKTDVAIMGFGLPLLNVMLLRALLLLLAVTCTITTNSQCITTYPYSEDFEATNGNWASGGSGDDWAWGAVSKAVIAQAASGSNCWVTGGLTNSFYNLGEQSYVESPCFDFSSLTKPYIRFNIYWETENNYDGAGFQYSIDGGTTWLNVGSYSNVQCNNNHWFNNAGVTYLGGFTNIRNGWSGNVQQNTGSCQGGNGSNGWKNASQCMPYLAGKPDVRFRFIFGAGTQCNNYDGFAFDDIYISDSPVPNFDFTYNCNGDILNITPGINPPGYDCYDSVLFYIDGVLKSVTNGGLTLLSYNMGTNGYNPAFPHTFSIEYRGPCHAPYTVTKRIPDFAFTTAAIQPSCPGIADGQTSITITGVNQPTSISWNSTPPQQGNTATGLPAGSYYATLTDAFNCAIHSDTLTLNGNGTLDAGLIVTPDTCGKQTGSITSITTGGTSPYVYSWSNGATGSSITNLTQGNYSVTITDINNCTVAADTVVGYESGMLLALTGQNVPCRKTTGGQVSVTASGGQTPYSYVWSNQATQQVVKNLGEGTYTVTVTDVAGCSVTGSIPVQLTYCPSYVYFPTAFSPNSDGANDVFRARFSDDLDKFNLQVYNRWGELVFESNNKLDGWDGIYKGIAQPLGVYAWTARYSFDGGETQTQSGNITLVR